MRILHTGDWHLGRIFHGVHLTQDQAYVLDQLVAICRESSIDVVLVAGDVYDRSLPPTDAVELMSEVLEQIVVGLKIPVILIAGNHDSPQRIGFCSRLLSGRGLHLRGDLKAVEDSIVIKDEHGPVHFFALPFVEPALVRETYATQQATDHNQTMGFLTQRIQRCLGTHRRSVLVAHAFLKDGFASDSERPLMVGQAGQVDPTLVHGFDYVALGHLHKAQSVQQPWIQYSGSIMKYSFAESDHTKSVSLVELDQNGFCSIERIALEPLHDVRVLEGTLENLLKNANSDPKPNDYIMASLHDSGVVWDPVGRLRTCYPNVLHVARPTLFADQTAVASVQQRKLTLEDIFAAFYQHRRGQDLSPEQKKAFQEVVEKMRQARRQGDA